MYYVSRSFKNEINYILPGSEQLKDPGNSDKENSTSSPPAPAPSFSSPQLPPNSLHTPYPGLVPPMLYPPGPISTLNPLPIPASNLVDDLSRLGDLEALLGVAQAPPPVEAFQHRQSPVDPRFIPQDRPYPYTDVPYGGERRPMGDMPMVPPQEGRYGGQNEYRDGGSRPGQRRPYDRQNQGNRNGASGSEVREGFREADPETSGPLYSDNLFVGSLPTDMGEADLRDMFGKFGHLRRVTVKGEKSFAFVAFGRRADAEIAKASLDGTQVLGKTLRIKWARSDKYREATVDPETGLLSFGAAPPLPPPPPLTALLPPNPTPAPTKPELTASLAVFALSMNLVLLMAILPTITATLVIMTKTKANEGLKANSLKLKRGDTKLTMDSNPSPVGLPTTKIGQFTNTTYLYIQFNSIVFKRLQKNQQTFFSVVLHSCSKATYNSFTICSIRLN